MAKVNVNWEALTDYIRAHFNIQYKDQAAGAGIAYKGRFVPLRTIADRLPLEQEVRALLDFVESETGYLVSLDDVEAGVAPAGKGEPIHVQIERCLQI